MGPQIELNHTYHISFAVLGIFFLKMRGVADPHQFWIRIHIFRNIKTKGKFLRLMSIN